MAIELKKVHVIYTNAVKEICIEFTNGQFFELVNNGGKLVWNELPKLPHLEEPKVVAH